MNRNAYLYLGAFVAGYLCGAFVVYASGRMRRVRRKPRPEWMLWRDFRR